MLCSADTKLSGRFSEKRCGPTARETHQRPWKISFVTPKGLFQQYRHETDLTRCRLFGRYRGISGSNTDINGRSVASATFKNGSDVSDLFPCMAVASVFDPRCPNLNLDLAVSKFDFCLFGELTGGGVMKRRRFEHTFSLEERLAEEAKVLREEAKTLPPGPERETLLRKARQDEIGAHMAEWITSPGLQPPK
jgi:hypothetical protein